MGFFAWLRQRALLPLEVSVHKHGNNCKIREGIPEKHGVTSMKQRKRCLLAFRIFEKRRWQEWAAASQRPLLDLDRRQRKLTSARRSTACLTRPLSCYNIADDGVASTRVRISSAAITSRGVHTLGRLCDRRA